MTKLTWQAVALLAIMAGVVVALATTTDWGSGEILAVIGVLASIGGSAAIGGAVAGRVDQVHAETTTQLRTIEKNTNGLSAAERQDIADRAAAAAIAALREESR